MRQFDVAGLPLHSLWKTFYFGFYFLLFFPAFFYSELSPELQV